MFNKKLISIRIDKDVLDQIDQYAGTCSYYKRSDVICSLLRAAVKAAIFENGKLKNEGKNLWNMSFTANFEAPKKY